MESETINVVQAKPSSRNKKKHLLTTNKGLQTDSMLPVHSGFNPIEEPDDELKGGTVSENKQVTISLGDLRRFMRCAQLVQIGLTNRINENQGIRGNPHTVLILQPKKDAVIDLMRNTIDRINKKYHLDASPNVHYL